MVVTTPSTNASTLLFRPLAISAQVFSGPYVDVPTLAQLGIEIEASAAFTASGVAANPQMSQTLCQEISLAFSNITMDPIFISQMQSTGNIILNGYSYNSQTINNFINLMISDIRQFFVSTTGTPLSPINSHKNDLAIILGVIITISVLFAVILIIFAIYMKLKLKKRSQLKVFDLVSFELKKRSNFESFTIDWDSLTNLEEIGSGS